MSRLGFTLVEVLVALVVAGLAVATAGAVFRASADSIRRLDEHSARWTREATGRRWLAHVFAGMEVGQDSAASFTGGPRRVEFHSRVWVPTGWVEPGSVQVGFDGRRLMGGSQGAADVVVADSLEDVVFEYLLARGAQSPWLPDWRSRTTTPLAVRLRLRRVDGSADTLLFLVGERG